MIIKTTRFGNIEIQDQEILTFPEGLLGFADFRKFVLLDDPNDEIFAWLQSCENASIAFPVLEPELFTKKYEITLAKNDMEVLKLAAPTGYRSFCIVTIPEDPTQMTANMKAPILINTTERIAKQCVLQDNQLAIKASIFADLQARYIQNPEKSLKGELAHLDFAVKVPHRTPEASV